MPPKDEKRVSARNSHRASAADKDDSKKVKSKDDSHNNGDTNITIGGGTADAAKKIKKQLLRTSHAPTLDPLLLARGMSARYLSSKLSSHTTTATAISSNYVLTTHNANSAVHHHARKITPLSRDQIEKDLRHMEAYRNACNGYNQQLFVFNNQELVKTGYFGTFAPGVVGADAAAAGVAGVGATKSKGVPPTTSSSSSSFPHPTKKFAMPIQIDPEKEKSLALLRKKIHSSEFEREQLETEYLSLRAHYVHISQLVRKTRGYEMGRWKFMRELMERRGRVLGWMRLRVAMARDVERLLLHRGRMVERVKRGELSGADVALMWSGRGDDGDKADGGGKDEKEKSDFIKMWNDVETKLKEAEVACIELETPIELLQMVQQSDKLPPTNSSSGDGGDGEKGGGGGGTKRRKRSSSINDEGDVYPNNNNNGDAKKKNPIPSGMEPHVIPWDCIVEPQTPYEVPILLSCLSSATDNAIGYVTDRSNPTAITWLTSTLPESTSAFDPYTDDLRKFKEEARLLEEELNRETELNTELQRQIIASRSRGDEMAALMQLMRSETEAVLERHNLIMETPEARAKAAELHKKFLEEQKLNNPSGGGDEDGDMDENEDLSRDDDSGEEGDAQDDDDDHSDDESVGIKEITVDKTDDNDDGVAAESDDDDEGSGSEGEMEEEPRRSKRGNSSAGDEESSSLTPPNPSSQRKRRRF